jgi:hypothetical protein
MVKTSCLLRPLYISLFLACSLSGFTQPAASLASVYQFQAPVEGRIAFLWVPPHCKYVRGIVFAMENALERNWMEDPIVRTAAAEEDLAMVWLADGKPTSITWEMKPDAIRSLDLMFRDLAAVSGYHEIENAPLVMTGHSWNGRAAWTYTNAHPDRVIMSIPIRTYPLPDSLQFPGVPMCYILGQTTELPQFNDGRPGDRDFFWPIVRRTALALRAKDERNLIGVVTYPGGCHMDWSDDQSRFLALLLHKACKYRLPEQHPADGRVKLRTLQPSMGWLTDTGGMAPDHFAPANYSTYMGDPQKAYWFLDKDVALAAIALSGDRKPRQKQMITFVQGNDTLEVRKNGYVNLQLQLINDEFHLKGGYLRSIPEGLVDAGQALGHAEGGFSFRAVMGPCIQQGPGLFTVRFDRQKPRNIMIMATQQGDATYRRALQPALITIPPELTEGKEQSINFPQIDDQPSTIKNIPLKATASSGLPVHYYVVSGPAVVDGDQLLLTNLPPKTITPVKVSVVAYQWGSMTEPKMQSAPMITRTFNIRK